MKRYIGIDLHKNQFTVCYRDERENEELREYAMSQLDDFKRTLYSEDEIGLEATGNSRYFCDAVKDLVSAVRVVNPSQFKVISSSAKKTDKQDAALLALYLSKGLFPEVRVMDSERARLKSLLGTRDRLTKLRTALKNKIHNILNAHGIVSRKESLSSRKGLEKILDYELENLSKFELGILVDQINHLNEGIEKINQELKNSGNQLPGHKNLTSIKGIGDVSANVLLSVIGDINDFSDAKKLSAYFGIVPRVHQSNETEHHGRITKQGSKIGRTTLVQCTLIAIRYSSYLRGYYDRLKAKKGSGKAIIATSRKLLGIIYDTLKNDIIWEDFPNGVIQSSRSS
jgi:transposase